jgi:spore coat protein U-like protein
MRTEHIDKILFLNKVKNKRLAMKTKFLLIILVLISNFINATTVTTTFPVSATVPASCIINSSSGIVFGNYSSSQIAASGTISVTCSNTIGWTLELNQGSSSGGTISSRLLSYGVNSLAYNLYRDPSYTTVFGDYTSGSAGWFTNGTGSLQTVTVYGKINGQQYPTPGIYSDTVTVSLLY